MRKILMSDDIWSKQFYKALEAVGNLTEQEKLFLGEMLVSLSGNSPLPKRDVKILPLRQLGNMWC